MNSPMTDLSSFGFGGLAAADRPSPEFIRAVAELLETDAADLLSEMGYVPTEAVVCSPEPILA